MSEGRSRPQLPGAEHLRRAEELGRRQADLEHQEADRARLMPGEDPGSPYPDDADHWFAVYGELVAFKERLLGQISQDRQRLLPDTADELVRDQRAMELELERLRHRLRYWEERHNHLLAQ